MHARLRRLVVSAVVLVGLAGGAAVALPTAASAATSVTLNGYENDVLVRMNAARTSSGTGALSIRPGLTDLARSWATTLSQRGTLAHNPDLGDQAATSGAPAWRTAAENVGVGGSSASIVTAYMNSPAHKANIMRTSVSNVGVGTARSSDGRIWDVVVFTDSYSDTYGATRTPMPAISADGSSQGGGTVVTGGTPNNGAGAATIAAGAYLAPSIGAPAAPFVSYGQAGDRYLSCDWDGNGTDTLGIFRQGTWYLRNSNTTGAADTVLRFGDPGDQPICGDWDGNGTDTVGVYRQGQVFLRNANTTGPADGKLLFGSPGDTAVVGDWDGDGFDTLGVRRQTGFFYLTNSNLRPTTNGVVALGNRGDLPVSGDWNGDGFTTLGVVRGGTWYLLDSNLGSRVSKQFGFGNPSDSRCPGTSPVVAPTASASPAADPRPAPARPSVP